MRKFLIVTLMLVFTGAVIAATVNEDLLKQVAEMKAQGLYDEALWHQAFGEPGPNPGLDEGGEVIPGLYIATLPFTDIGYTCDNVDDYDEVCPYSGSTSPDVVYEYSPAVNEVVDITLCLPGTNYDTKLYVYQNGHTPGAPFACNDDKSPSCPPPGGHTYASELLGLNLVGGNSYFIVVDGYGGNCGDYEILVQNPPPPPGTNCSYPISITLPDDLDYTTVDSTCSRIDDYDATCLGSYDGGEDIIYEVVVNSAVTVDITLTTTTTWTGICIDDNCPPDLSCIAMSTNTGSGAQTMSGVVLAPGTYYIMIDTWPSPDCIPSFTLDIVDAGPPPPPCGGPDCGNYYWASNDRVDPICPSQPDYNWRNVFTNSVILGTNSIVQNDTLGDDDWEGPYPLGFSLNYYNSSYDSFCICSNGFVTLGNTGATALSNSYIPDSYSPNSLLALFWDDMNPSDTGIGNAAVYWGNDAVGNMVISFYNLAEYTYGGAGPDDGLTAQIVICPNGNITYNYAWIGSTLDILGCTIGIEDSLGTCGTEYLYNGTGEPIHSGLSIMFGTNPNSLPVELTSFEAVGMDKAARLTWITASEHDNSHFALYRSTTENGEYTQIATVEAVGNTANESDYSYVDRNLVNGVTYYYRLEDVDINGNATVHEVTVNATPGEGAMGVVVDNYRLYQNYPNPFNPTTTITYDVKEAGHVTLAVYNLLGQEVMTLVDQVQQSNRYQVSFNASGLAAGVYFYRVNVNEFSDVAKMVLLK